MAMTPGPWLTSLGAQNRWHQYNRGKSQHSKRAPEDIFLRSPLTTLQGTAGKWLCVLCRLTEVGGRA